MKEKAILIRIIIKLGENGSVYLDLASGKGNEELDSRIYHLKLHSLISKLGLARQKKFGFFFIKFVSLCRSVFLFLCFSIPIKNPFYIFFLKKQQNWLGKIFSYFPPLSLKYN